MTARIRSGFFLYAAIGGVAAIVLGLLMAPTGGFPSRPRFQEVTISSGTAAGNGNLRVNAGKLTVVSPTSNMADFDGQTVNAFVRFSRSAVDVGYIGSGDSIGGGADSNDLAFTAVTNATADMVFATGVTRTERLRLTATGDLVGRGVMTHRAKAADTARVSTTVLANDPDMVYAIPAAGTYRFRAWIQIDGTTTGTQGFGFNVNYSGTFTSPASHYIAETFCSGAVGLGGSAVAAAVTTLQINSCSTLNTTDSDNAVRIEGTLVATGTGNLGVSWAQLVSNANATNARDGSSLEVTRIL